MQEIFHEIRNFRKKRELKGDPVSLMIIGGGISAATSIVGGIQQKQAIEAQAKSQAEYLEQTAEEQEEATELELAEHDKNIRRLLGAQRAAFAGSGIDVSAGGTPSVVQEQSAMQGEVERQIIEYGGALEANKTRTQAELTRLQGKSRGTTALTSGIGSALSTAGSTLASVGRTQNLRLTSK